MKKKQSQSNYGRITITEARPMIYQHKKEVL